MVLTVCEVGMNHRLIAGHIDKTRPGLRQSSAGIRAAVSIKIQVHDFNTYENEWIVNAETNE